MGRQGRDTLNGGTGDDLLIGGIARDSFEFAAGDGDDTIEDFQVDTDTFVLLGDLTIDSVEDTDTDGGGGADATLVTFDSGDTVTLLGLVGLDEDDLFL